MNNKNFSEKSKFVTGRNFLGAQVTLDACIVHMALLRGLCKKRAVLVAN